MSGPLSDSSTGQPRQKWAEVFSPAHERRVVVWAPTANDAWVTANILQRGGLDVQLVQSCDALCRLMSEGCGAIVIAEEVLTPKTSAAVFDLLTTQPTWSDLPVVLVASQAHEGTELRRRMIFGRLNASVTVLERPFRPSTLVSALEVALRSRTRQYQVRHLLSELGEARDAAQQANQAKDDFLAALSHELRTPLNPALLIASAAAANAALPEEVQRDFGKIASSIELEAKLIDDLLDITKVVRGKLSLDLGRVDVHEALSRVLAILEADFTTKKIVVVKTWRARNAVVMADPVRLQQVLWNVLKNAAKFTPESGQISVSTVNENGSVCVQVVDTGIGMSPDELSRIFNAFAQGTHADLKQGHRYGGLGLGLAISKQLIDLHGGEIIATSEGMNRGSVFTIRLPELLDAPADVPPRPSTTPAASDASSLSGVKSFQRALLVEDHPTTRVALACILKKRGYVVETASCLAEARTTLQKMRFDLLITDIGLPDGNGHELSSELQAQPLMRGIVMSGYGMEADVVKTRENGFSKHLIKPVSIAALEEAIRSLR